MSDGKESDGKKVGRKKRKVKEQELYRSEPFSPYKASHFLCYCFVKQMQKQSVPANRIVIFTDRFVTFTKFWKKITTESAPQIKNLPHFPKLIELFTALEDGKTSGVPILPVGRETLKLCQAEESERQKLLTAYLQQWIHQDLLAIIISYMNTPWICE